jgi:hypothetical protein
MQFDPRRKMYRVTLGGCVNGQAPTRKYTRVWGRSGVAMSDYDDASYGDDYGDDFSQDQGGSESSGQSEEADEHQSDSKRSLVPSSEYTPAGTMETPSNTDQQGECIVGGDEVNLPVKVAGDDRPASEHAASERGSMQSIGRNDAAVGAARYLDQTGDEGGNHDATEESGYTDDDYGTASHDASEASRDGLEAALREVAATAMPTLVEASQESAASPEPEPGSQLGGGSSLVSGDEPAVPQRRNKPQLTLSPVRMDTGARAPKSSAGNHQSSVESPAKPQRKPPVPRQPRRPNADGSASSSSVPEPPVPEEPAYVPDWRALAGLSVHSSKSSHASTGSHHSGKNAGPVVPDSPAGRREARPVTQESGRRRKKSSARSHEDPFAKVRAVLTRFTSPRFVSWVWCGVVKVRELEERMRFLQWRKKENETRLREVMTTVRAQQAHDAQECLATRREDASERLLWAAAVIQDELDKPLAVDKVTRSGSPGCVSRRA